MRSTRNNPIQTGYRQLSIYHNHRLIIKDMFPGIQRTFSLDKPGLCSAEKPLSHLAAIRVYRRMLFPAFLLMALLPGSPFSAGVAAQRIPAEKPKLVVGITVSGMRYDYLSTYWEKFGDDGFRRLASTGTWCRNARYDYLITESAVGYATIATGARPDAHGIVADYWYERLSDQVEYCVHDPDYDAAEGNNENGRYSPEAMMSRTLSDELRIVNQFQSKVIGVSLDPRASVLLSGHTANAAFWLNPEHGTWNSSTYYLDSLPGWVDTFNLKNYKEIYLEKTWEPLLPVSDYEESLPDNNPYEEGLNGQITFPYELDRLANTADRTDYSLLMSTPYGNTYTKDFAIQAMVNEELGKRGVTDWMNVGFNVTRYLSERYSTWSMEMQDTYLRLDRDIAHLLEFLDDHVGLENVLVYLTADNALADDPRFLEEHRIPSGYFNYHSNISLLKSYLNAVYGQGDWVRFYYAQQIYLNHQLIEDSRLSLEEVQDRVARFMIRFTGVSNALPAYILQRNNFTEGIFKRIQNSYNQKRSGDVILYLTPGWVEKGSDLRESYADFKYDAHVPLIFYGWKINRATLPRRVSPLDIVPTIAYLLQLSIPENATGSVIPEVVQ